METKAGQPFRDSRTGKAYMMKKPCYYLYIRASSLPEFQKHISFAIKRKKLRLLEVTQG